MLIMDEVSMAACSYITQFERRNRQMRDAGLTGLGGDKCFMGLLSFVACGDFAQLLPIDAARLGRNHD